MAESKLYSVRAPIEPLGTIGLPVRDHLNAATATAMISTALLPGGFINGASVDFNIVQGSVLTIQRNELVNRMRGDWLLFIDDDMVWQPHQIAALIETREKFDLDMVGALCFQRSEPYNPTLYMRERPDGGLYNFLESWPDDEAVEVDATGLAFLLIHKRVFERMVAHYEDKPGWMMPAYEDRVGHRPPNIFRWEGGLGEDLRFCQEAKAAGSRIFVDTSIEVGHIGEVSIGRRHFLSELASRGQDIYEKRRDINDAMGLPSVSPAEAKLELGW
jgi:hypothetical protein